MDDREPDRVSITDARVAHSVDLKARQRRYLISMGIRTVCFVCAVIATGPLRWFFVFGAIFLPYVAVVLANTGKQTAPTDADVYRPEPIGELTEKPHEAR
ncbi:MAG: DUF3099 domain-containing protein [Nocardioidaceae bacterium]|jgi:hypothetical protein|nr:DUF3099 domain-containing protein [Nocardioidaceae bacterium]